jgi:hypothetical protein
MMRLIVALMALGFLLTIPAVALNAKRVPPTAKKLTAEEIIRLYDGHTVAFSNSSMNKPLTGEFTFDFKTKTIAGTYRFGDDKGAFKGTIRMKGDNYCYKVRKNKEVCATIYRDGANIYEVNSRGTVTSQNRIVR